MGRNRAVGRLLLGEKQSHLASVRLSLFDPGCDGVTTIPGVGPITATAIAALAPPPETFRKGRDFAAWVGLTPSQHSIGGIGVGSFASSRCISLVAKALRGSNGRRRGSMCGAGSRYECSDARSGIAIPSSQTRIMKQSRASTPSREIVPSISMNPVSNKRALNRDLSRLPCNGFP